MLGIFRVMLLLQPFYIDHWGEAFHENKKIRIKKRGPDDLIWILSRKPTFRLYFEQAL